MLKGGSLGKGLQSWNRGHVDVCDWKMKDGDNLIYRDTRLVQVNIRERSNDVNQLILCRQSKILIL